MANYNDERALKRPSKYTIVNAASQAISRSVYAAGININQSIKGVPLRDKPLYLSKIGTGVYADLTMPSFTWTDFVTGDVFTVPEIKMYSMLIKTQHNKVIVKTYITGLNGSVKEYITTGDSQLVIEGVITGANGTYPSEEVSALNQLVTAPVAFKVVSSFLQNLDIDTVVIDSADINQEEGSQSYQKFTLYCSSDIPVELNIVAPSNTN